MTGLKSHTRSGERMAAEAHVDVQASVGLGLSLNSEFERTTAELARLREALDNHTGA